MQTILFSSIRSPHCFKVLMLLNEKALPYELVEIDLPSKEQKTQAYLNLNPLGQVPVLKDDKGVHIDSLVIMQYLDESYPNPTLFPKDKTQKQEVLNWIELSSSSMRDVSHHLYWQLIEPPESGTDWQEVKRLKDQGYQLLNKLEQSLRQNQWLCGDLSAADLSVFAWLHGYKRFQLPETWQSYPKLKQWLETLEQRSSVQASYLQKGIAFSEYLANSASS